MPHAGQGLFLLGLLLLHLGEDRERQEHLVARSVGWRQLPLGERSQVTVHLRFELGLIREPVIQHLPRLFERLAEVEHLLKLRAIVGHRRRINVLEEDEDLRGLRFPSPLLLPTGERAVKLFFRVRRVRLSVRSRLTPPAVHARMNTSQRSEVEPFERLSSFAPRKNVLSRSERRRSCDRRPVEANVSSQPSGSNLMSSASPKPALSSSSTCWNAARSTAKSPGEAMKTRIVRMSDMRGTPDSGEQEAAGETAGPGDLRLLQAH